MDSNYRLKVLYCLLVALVLVANSHATSGNEKQSVVERFNTVHDAKSTKSSQQAVNNPSANNKKLIDINKASKAELMTLPAIGEMEANKIIAGRPYNSKADIVTHGQLSGGVYQIIKPRIVVK